MLEENVAKHIGCPFRPNKLVLSRRENDNVPEIIDVGWAPCLTTKCMAWVRASGSVPRSTQGRCSRLRD